MKIRFMYILFCALVLCAGCFTDYNDGDISNGNAASQSLNASLISGGSDANPIIFVHGLVAIGGDTYYYLYEKFAAQGFPTSKMKVMNLPRYNTGDALDFSIMVPPPADHAAELALMEHCAWFALSWVTDPFTLSHWHKQGTDNANCGNSGQNVPALKSAIDTILAQTGASKVDLIGHSNGSIVIRETLLDPVYAAKIRKVIFISGFADVSGAYNAETVARYMREFAPDSSLPTGVLYYAISSESDANMDGNSWYGEPDNNNTPSVYADTLRYWNTANGKNPTNYNISGMDHMRLCTNSETFSTIFNWLTGTNPGTPSTPSTITIGGTIILQTPNGYTQGPVTSGTVTVKYYNPSTGLETGSAGSCTITSAGKYSISNLNTTKYLKIKVSANGGNDIYFVAQKITQNCGNLDLSAPKQLTDHTANGDVSIKIICAYSFLSCYNYENRPADHFIGTINVPNDLWIPDISLDSTCITTSTPTSYMSIKLQNYGYTDSIYGGNVWNFDAADLYNWNSKNINVIADLQHTDVNIKVRINGADRSNNINNNILYLYR